MNVTTHSRLADLLDPLVVVDDPTTRALRNAVTILAQHVDNLEAKLDVHLDDERHHRADLQERFTEQLEINKRLAVLETRALDEGFIVPLDARCPMPGCSWSRRVDHFPESQHLYLLAEHVKDRHHLAELVNALGEQQVQIEALTGDHQGPDHE